MTLNGKVVAAVVSLVSGLAAPLQATQAQYLNLPPYDPNKGVEATQHRLALSHLAQGNYLYQNGQYPQAIAEFDLAIQHSGSGRVAYEAQLNRGLSYAQLGRNQAAFNDFDEVRNVSPDFRMAATQALAELCKAHPELGPPNGGC